MKKKKLKDDENYVPKAFQKEKKQANKSSKHEKTKLTRKEIIKKIIKILIIIIIVIAIIKYLISYFTWKTIATDMIKNTASEIINTDGKVVETIGNEKIKSYVKLSDMPDNLKNAYVAIEDERYYKHFGIDIKRTGAAIVSYVIHGGSSSFGGSTITQQLVKNLTGDSSSSVTRMEKSC